MTTPARIQRRRRAKEQKSVSGEQNFTTKINKAGPIPAHMPDLGPCWIWKGAPNKKGYGRVTVNLRSDGSDHGRHSVSSASGMP